MCLRMAYHKNAFADNYLRSDALGHVLNMLGRDWTHQGVAKLFTDIVSNGYHIMYLTSRSTGQADTTRTYLNGVLQDGYRLPKGPVIMSPDRTIAALRREIYLRKPEVFKMACLRDILSLFPPNHNPFYAGFGNRLTDALSYRSVNIPSSRIFTINSNAEVSLDLLSLNKYKSSYVSIRELVDHFFPPISLLVQGGGEDFTDFTYWRDPPPNLDDFSVTDSEAEDDDEGEEESDHGLSDDEGSEVLEDDEHAQDLEASYISRGYIDSPDIADSMVSSAADLQILGPQECLSLEVDELATKSDRETQIESGSNSSFDVLQPVMA
jgi:phosphatidate phosphatase LPIN